MEPRITRARIAQHWEEAQILTRTPCGRKTGNGEMKRKLKERELLLTHLQIKASNSKGVTKGKEVEVKVKERAEDEAKASRVPMLMARQCWTARPYECPRR